MPVLLAAFALPLLTLRLCLALRYQLPAPQGGVEWVLAASVAGAAIGWRTRAARGDSAHDRAAADPLPLTCAGRLLLAGLAAAATGVFAMNDETLREYMLARFALSPPIAATGLALAALAPVAVASHSTVAALHALLRSAILPGVAHSRTAHPASAMLIALFVGAAAHPLLPANDLGLILPPVLLFLAAIWTAWHAGKHRPIGRSNAAVAPARSAPVAAALAAAAIALGASGAWRIYIGTLAPHGASSLPRLSWLIPAAHTRQFPADDGHSVPLWNSDLSPQRADEIWLSAAAFEHAAQSCGLSADRLCRRVVRGLAPRGHVVVLATVEDSASEPRWIRKLAQRMGPSCEVRLVASPRGDGSAWLVGADLDAWLSRRRVDPVAARREWAPPSAGTASP